VGPLVGSPQRVDPLIDPGTHGLVRRVAVTAMVVAALVASGCASGDDPPRASPEPGASTTTEPVVTTTMSPGVTTDGPTDPVIDAGVAAMQRQFPTMDAVSLTIVDYVFRNWGIAGLSGARPAAEAKMAGPDLADDELVLARLIDGSAPPPAGLEDLREPTTALLATALHCDQSPVPPGFFEAAAGLTAEGGYGATHAGLAVGWMAELGCTSDELAAATTEVTEQIASEFEAGLEAGAGVTDLAVEQSALLFYLGAGDRVPPSWGDDVRAAQNPDGSWGQGVTWHMTMLAIWTLAALASPGAGVPLVGPAAA
jgi:hypothetical protein